MHTPVWVCLLATGMMSAVLGCAHRNHPAPQPAPSPRILVIAPVLNLSGSTDFDPLKVTDLVASEFQSFPDVAVIPVNLALAELERRGQAAVESPQDAVDLARALGADATIVVGVTEYNPYHPPIVGWVMQWYAARSGWEERPVEGAGESAQAGMALSEPGRPVPRYQVQRVFNAADEAVVKEVREFARSREGHQSPFGWRKYIRSQELYVRFSCSATIRSMLSLDHGGHAAVKPNEAES